MIVTLSKSAIVNWLPIEIAGWYMQKVMQWDPMNKAYVLVLSDSPFLAAALVTRTHFCPSVVWGRITRPENQTAELRKTWLMDNGNVLKATIMNMDTLPQISWDQYLAQTSIFK